MNEEQLKNIHELQIKMISDLQRVCEENNLRYTLVCGSLLGTIRHNGFIPWDDDMDIGLMRADYEKLIVLLREKPIEGCFLQDYSTDPHYYQPYAKLLKCDTVYIENYRKHCKAQSGIFIDIFPLDSIKKPGQAITKFRRTVSRFITFAVWNKEHCKMERVGKKKAINGIAAVISVLPKKMLINLQRILVVRDRSDWDYVASMFSSNYETDRLYFERSDFDNLIDHQFENITVKIPATWEANLRRLYKDYMKLPPVEKRNSGHDVYKVSLNEE